MRALDADADGRGAGAGRRIQRRAGRRSARPDRGPAGQHRDHRRRQHSARRGRRGVGRRRRRPRWRTASAGWNACRAYPARRARHRCRTSAPTGPRSPTRSGGCGCWTARTGEDRWVGGGELGFGYRTSILKHSDAAIVLEVEFALDADGRSAPLRYGELTAALGAEPGARADPARVRDAVLALRTRKGMVLDDADHDTWSVGSFFTNPVVTPERVRAAEATSGRRTRAQLPGAGRGEAGRGLAGRAGRLRQGLSRTTARRPGCPPSTRWR